MRRDRTDRGHHPWREISAFYASAREGYAPAALSEIEGTLADTRLILDLGCGTGQLTSWLGDRSHIAIGIDSEAAMLARARREPGVGKGSCYVHAKADRLPLKSGSIDAIVCAQAFHWFPGSALDEIGRVLRVGGHLVIMWNTRDETSALTAAYGNVLRMAASLGPSAAPGDREPPECQLDRLKLVLTSASSHAFSWPCDEEMLVRRAKSVSFFPRLTLEGIVLDSILRNSFRHFTAGSKGAISFATALRFYQLAG
jgi:SAM-dependent methyltransferase